MRITLVYTAMPILPQFRIRGSGKVGYIDLVRKPLFIRPIDAPASEEARSKWTGLDQKAKLERSHDTGDGQAIWFRHGQPVTGTGRTIPIGKEK